MRDLVVREGLETLADDAAELLAQLVAGGEEIPYEVREPGDGSPLCRYEPRTERFVHGHARELRELDSYGTACAAIELGGLATGYLERMGVGVPEDARKRAEIATLVFLCRLWMGSSDFSLERDRLTAAIDEVDLDLDEDEARIEVVVPLRGFSMPVARIELGSVAIIRADTVEVPVEARAADGLGVSPFEPAFLAVVLVDADADAAGDPGLEAVERFRRMVTTLRMFKAGGVGLGPHAWTRIAGDRWRRISTGCGRQRPGGYRLTEQELGDLLSFSRALTTAGTPFERLMSGRPGFPAVLGRAINRFEAGLERNVVIEALNDHLLAMRFLLEGGGPADLGLPMRVAALCAEPGHRGEVKTVVDRAIGLERELWSGEPPERAGVSPAQTAAELEELVRAVLKDASVGHLGTDLRVTADEILLADGLAVGDGAGEQRGGTTEWDLSPVEPDEIELATELEGLIERDDPGESAAALAGERDDRPPTDDLAVEEVSDLDGRIWPERTSESQEETVSSRAQEIFGSLAAQDAPAVMAPADEPTERPTTSLEVLPSLVDERDERSDPASEPRPASPVLRLIEQTRAECRARSGRVAELFPRPETTEWNVRDISYDRNRRAELDQQAELTQ